MEQIDKQVQQFAVLNLAAAIITNPTGFATLRDYAAAHNISTESALTQMATSFAMSALRDVNGNNLFSLPAGPLSDVLTLYIECSQAPGREAYEDTQQQEGELASNAAALLLNEPGFWTDEVYGEGDAVTFPGTGANTGPERINDLVRAGAYVLAEIMREVRKEVRDAEYAEQAASRGVAVEPVAGDVSQGEVTIAEADPTQH